MGGRGSGPKPKGRPTKLTRQVHEEVVRLMQAGNYLETAAACCDISPPTLRAWLKRGARQKRGIYRAFFIAVKKAEAQAESHALVRIRQAGKQQWTAEAWYLERKFPSRWGRWDRKPSDGREDIERAREYVKRKDVRDLLDEVARRVGVDGYAGESGDEP